MNALEMDELRYPIGKFIPLEHYTETLIHQYLQKLLKFPNQLDKEIENLSEQQLDTPYREGGWSVRQVVHHLADSHLNAYIRTKWTVTEEKPLIKAYDEKAWATTPDNKISPSISIALLSALHQKWVDLINGLPGSALGRSFTHPSGNREIILDRMVHLYTWHGEHHLNHIISLKRRMNW